MMLLDVETSLRAHLEQHLFVQGVIHSTDYQLEVIQDSASQQYRMLHPRATLWLRFDGEDVKIIGFQADETTLMFTVIVMTRDLRTHNGAYSLLGHIKQAFRFTLIPELGMTKNMKIRFRGKLEDTPDVWVYEVQVAIIVHNIVY